MGLIQDIRLSPIDQANAAATDLGYVEVTRAVLAVFDPRLQATRPLRVLEAGGGSNSWVPLPPDAEVTTIDICPEQLARNTYAREKLCGDLQTFDYGPRRFDLIVCWDVLEHLPRPDAALDRFATILAPGGRLLVKGPLKNTVKGLVTRWTPHAAHVAFYRHILQSLTAGKPGHPPFEAYLETTAAPEGLVPLLQQHGLTVDGLQRFESAHVAAIAKRSRLLFAAYRMSERILWAVTLGRYSHSVTDFFVVARRSQ